MRPNNETIPQAVERRIYPVYQRVRDYHGHDVVGLEHIPQKGAALLVFTHSLATYDILLFGAAVYYQRQRLIAALVDRLVMKTPLLRDFARSLQAVAGEPGVARSLLASGRLVGVAPGGMREALRSAGQRYSFDWEKRFGFARLALESQAPVVLAACPAADELYTVIDNPVTRFVYDKLRMPMPLAFGRRMTPLPRAVKLTHYVSKPIAPPKIAGAQATRDEIQAFHAELSQSMRDTIAHGLSHGRLLAERDDTPEKTTRYGA